MCFSFVTSVKTGDTLLHLIIIIIYTTVRLNQQSQQWFGALDRKLGRKQQFLPLVSS